MYIAYINEVSVRLEFLLLSSYIVETLPLQLLLG